MAQADNLVFEDQTTDISWYNDEIPDGSAKNNFDRIILLRKAFCHPLTINKDGTLNKKYFSNIAKETAMNWNDIELLQLYAGIFKHGVDCIEKWHKIQSEFLPQRDFIEVRIKLSQLFGVQDLSQYKGRIFKSEQEIQAEFDKNKGDALQNGTWCEKSNISLKPEVAKLTQRDEQKLAKKELEEWKKYIYNNPHYVYRINNNRTSNKSNNNNKGNKNKNKKKQKTAKKSQKNTVEQMFKKQAEKVNDVEMDKKEEEVNNEENKNKKVVVVEEEDNDIDLEKKEEMKVVEKAKVQQMKQKKSIIPEDSDDEEMLCVE